MRLIAVADMIADIREHLIDSDMIAGGDIDCNDILNRLGDIAHVLTDPTPSEIDMACDGMED